MESIYHEGHRRWQDRFDSRRLADRIEEKLAADALGPDETAFVEAADMFFLATADGAGRPTCSYKGGDPGFVRVLDPRTLAFPLYDGNGMFLSSGNLGVNPNVGLLFIDFQRGHRLRIEGEATVSDDAASCSMWPGARLVIRVAIRAAYPNCVRYVHRMTRAARSEYVPQAGCEPPVPGWKRAEWAKGFLPAGDPATRGPTPGPP